MAALASKFKKNIYCPNLRCYCKSNYNDYASSSDLFLKPSWGINALRSRSYIIIHSTAYIKKIRARFPWSYLLHDNLGNTVGNRQSFATHGCPPEATADEIFKQFPATKDDPCVSKKETCVSYIKTLCLNRKRFAAFRLIQSLRGKNIFLDPTAYDFLLESASEERDLDMLFEIFKELMLYCRNIRLTSYLIVAGAFAKPTDSTLLLEFIGEISEMNLPRKDIVLNRVIFAFSRCGHVEEALLVFNHMKSLKCKPDVVTYNTILDILGRRGRVDEMLQEFNVMKTVHLIPDIITYNTILNSLRKVGRLDLSLVYFKEMNEAGLQPDVLTFKALIESLGRSGNIQMALEVFDAMRCKGIHPSIHIYRALISCLKKMEKMELALKFAKEMNELIPESIGWRGFHNRNR